MSENTESNLKFMDEDKIKTLESLLNELWGELGNRYYITPCHMGENIQIATYDSYGNLIKRASGDNLKTALDKFL